MSCSAASAGCCELGALLVLDCRGGLPPTDGSLALLCAGHGLITTSWLLVRQTAGTAPAGLGRADWQDSLGACQVGQT